jgi:TolA-binding protein
MMIVELHRGTRMKRTQLPIVILRIAMLLCALTCATYAINVGDTPRLELSTLNHGVVRLGDFRGRAVLVHFWLPWDGDSLNSLEHMAKLREKYGARGLSLIGICITDEPVAAQRIVKDQRIDWPQHVDAESIFANGWGVGARSYAVLIGPDGHVVFHGSTADTDGALELLFQKAAPATSPAAAASTLPTAIDLRDANAAMDRAEAALNQNQIVEAARQLWSVAPASRRLPAVAPRHKQLAEKLNATADSTMIEADLLIGEQKYAAAAAKLRSLAGAPNDLPDAVKARQLLANLMNKPEARQQIDNEQRGERAQQALTVAYKLQTDGKDELAYARFKSIPSDYPDTPAASVAQGEIKNYEANTKFMQAVSRSKLAQARSALSLADSYRRSGKLDLAKAKYQEVIDQFPGTKEADTAASALTSLTK